MKETLISIDGAGRLVLPKEIREQLAIEGGDLLNVRVEGNEVSLRRKTDRAGLVRKKHALVFSSGDGAALERETVERVLSETREETGAQLARRMGGKGQPR